MHVKNFLKSDRFHHRNPDTRRAAIESLDADDPKSPALFHELASKDEDASVRIAAINRLDDVPLLLSLLETDAVDPQPVRPQVHARIMGLLEAGRCTDTDIDLLLAQRGESWLMAVAAHCASGEQRLHALQRIDMESALVEVIEHSRFHDARLHAAERLDGTDAMKSALSACRSRDKLVARKLQERLDERSAAAARRTSDEQTVESTLEQVRALAGSVWSPQHAGRMQALLARWHGLPEDLREPHEAAFAEHQAQVRAQLDEHMPAVPRAAEAARGASQTGSTADHAVAATIATNGGSEVADIPADADAGINAVTDSTAEGASGNAIRGSAIPDGTEMSNASGPVATESAGAPGIDTDTAAPAPVAPTPEASAPLLALKQHLGTATLADLPAIVQRLRAEPAAESAPDSDALLAHAEAVAVLFDPPFAVAKGRPQATRDRLGRVNILLDIPALLPATDVTGIAYLDELVVHRDALATREEKARQESADRVAATHRQFAALAGAVADGKWAPASSMLRRLQKKMAAMEPAERAGLADKLARAEKQLEEMSDWQDFASRPKLEALCEQMEALAADTQPKPRVRAKAVKDLQNQWKTMGVSRVANELWPRFKTAGDTAFEPCKTFFEQQRQERDAKLGAKAALCETLETTFQSIDSEAPDYKAIQRQVNNAKREWSRNRVADRKPDKALEERFSNALKPFDALLAEQYDANALVKQDLLDKVSKLAEGEINQHTANQARSLQSAWKQVGIMRRREDQALWEAFNAHCREIFKRQHDAEREKYRASMGHVFRARDIIKEMNRLAKEGQPDDARVQALTAEYHALEAFPDKERKFLQRDFRAAADACSRIRETQSKRRRQAEQEEIQRLVNLCEQLEDAVEMPDSMGATTRDDVEHAWEATDVRAPREELQALEARRDTALAHLNAGSRFDYTANEELRRDLLIRLEVSTGSETPAEDKPRRMRYQLENLQAGMTSGAVTDTRTAIADLSRQWYSLGPVTRAQRDALQSRFLKATGR